MNLFKEVLWNGHRCEVLAEDTEARLIKVRKIDGTEVESIPRHAGIWLRYDCVTFIEGKSNEP